MLFNQQMLGPWDLTVVDRARDFNFWIQFEKFEIFFRSKFSGASKECEIQSFHSNFIKNTLDAPSFQLAVLYQLKLSCIGRNGYIVSKKKLGWITFAEQYVESELFNTF